MKRILLACFLLTATVSIVQRVSAQTVTAASFSATANQMDTYIGAGNMPMAQATFDTLNRMMKTVLGVSKMSIATAATPADKATYQSAINNQIQIYRTIWGLKADLALNRVALHAKLGEFDATIY
jgi:hypothetical protein